MSRHRAPEVAPSTGPRHRLVGRRAQRVPREYRHSGFGHRVVVEHPFAGVQAAVLTLLVGPAVIWFFSHLG